MERLVSVSSKGDIFDEYKNTPVGLLIEYQNLQKEHVSYDSAKLLIGMCMDNRKHLKIPENFAFIIRSGGGNLRYSEFKVSYAVSIGRVSSIVLIAHNHCGMVNLHSKKEDFINGLVHNGGWDKEWAEEHFIVFSPMFEIGNEIDFVLSEAERLRQRYPKIQVAPLFYNVDDNLLHQIRENC